MQHWFLIDCERIYTSNTYILYDWIRLQKYIKKSVILRITQIHRINEQFINSGPNSIDNSLRVVNI